MRLDRWIYGLYFCSRLSFCFCRSVFVCRCGCKYGSVFMNTFMCEPSSGRPNIAQRRQLLPLLSCLAPIHSIIPHSAAHIHPLFPCLFSKDISSLAKYMLAIIFHCMRFKDTSEGWLANYTESDRECPQRDILHKVKW